MTKATQETRYRVRVCIDPRHAPSAINIFISAPPRKLGKNTHAIKNIIPGKNMPSRADTIGVSIKKILIPATARIISANVFGAYRIFKSTIPAISNTADTT